MLIRINISYENNNWNFKYENQKLNQVQNLIKIEEWIIYVKDKAILVIPLKLQSINKEYFLQEGTLFLVNKKDRIYSFMRPKCLQDVLDALDAIKVITIGKKFYITERGENKVIENPVLYFEGIKMISENKIINGDKITISKGFSIDFPERERVPFLIQRNSEKKENIIFVQNEYDLFSLPINEIKNKINI